MTWLLMAAAIAAPADYKKTAEIDGCTLYKGPAESGVVPMYAECHWTDVTVKKFAEKMSDMGQHAQIFSAVEESETLKVDGTTVWNKQTHVNGGIADRELILRGWREMDDTHFRVEWTIATDMPLEVQKGNVATVRDDGWWDVTAAADGGVDIKYKLMYDPGGSVPGFIVRAFQVGGLKDILTECHAWVTKP